ncbi:MAG: Nramp family divalent metal transporter, partial [Flavobacteriaceae bacterium]
MTRLRIGPGILITAAFIGPGTLTACSLAGVHFGLTLLWALVFSLLLTGFLQLLVARLSWETGQGLVELVHTHTPRAGLRVFLLAWIVVAIFLGNAAYEAGNVSGALLGLEVFFPPDWVLSPSYTLLSMASLGLVLGGLLWKGNPRWIKNLLMAVVVLMSLSFLITAFLVGPSMAALFSGLWVPTWPPNSLLTVMALVGTTLVPYNLFLHAALVKKKTVYATASDLTQDTVIAIVLGGVISVCIVIAAAAVEAHDLRTAADLGQALAPLYGAAAPYLIGFGMFAAGLSSALTAPLAAAFVVQETLGWPSESRKTKGVALAVLFFGLASLGLQLTPTRLIQLAQIANALLLPFMALFLGYLVRKTNGRLWQQWGLGLLFVVFVGLGIKTLGGL